MIEATVLVGVCQPGFRPNQTKAAELPLPVRVEVVAARSATPSPLKSAEAMPMANRLVVMLWRAATPIDRQKVSTSPAPHSSQ